MCWKLTSNDLSGFDFRLVQNGYRVNRCRAGLRCSILLVAAVLFASQDALGSAPSYQTVNNPVTDFNAVVQMDVTPGTTILVQDPDNPKESIPITAGPDGFGEGTGSIVMKFKGLDGDYYACVLTADHVVSNDAPGAPGPFSDKGLANSIGFGNSTAPGTAAPDLYNIVSSTTGGSTGTKDLAMELVNLGNNPKANLTPGTNEMLTWNDINPLHPVSLAQYGYDPETNKYGYLVPKDTPFTTMGFGDSGVLFKDPLGNLSYLENVGSYGTKRFENNLTVGNIPGFAALPPYVYDAVTWNPLFGAGQGATFPGDSGSPMLASEPINYTINGVNVTINNVMTDDLFGVVTFGPASTTLTETSIEGGVTLTPADIAWIDESCDDFYLSTPEPGACVLFAVGLSAVFVATRGFRTKSGG
jgi:hypothetical protein